MYDKNLWNKWYKEAGKTYNNYGIQISMNDNGIYHVHINPGTTLSKFIFYNMLSNISTNIIPGHFYYFSFNILGPKGVAIIDDLNIKIAVFQRDINENNIEYIKFKNSRCIVFNDNIAKMIFRIEFNQEFPDGIDFYFRPIIYDMTEIQTNIYNQLDLKIQFSINEYADIIENAEAGTTTMQIDLNKICNTGIYVLHDNFEYINKPIYSQDDGTNAFILTVYNLGNQIYQKIQKFNSSMSAERYATVTTGTTVPSFVDWRNIIVYDNLATKDNINSLLEELQNNESNEYFFMKLVFNNCSYDDIEVVDGYYGSDGTIVRINDTPGWKSVYIPIVPGMRLITNAAENITTRIVADDKITVLKETYLKNYGINPGVLIPENAAYLVSFFNVNSNISNKYVFITNIPIDMEFDYETLCNNNLYYEPFKKYIVNGFAKPSKEYVDKFDLTHSSRYRRLYHAYDICACESSEN